MHCKTILLPVTKCLPSLCQSRHKIRPSCLSNTLSKSNAFAAPTRNSETYPEINIAEFEEEVFCSVLSIIKASKL